MKAVVATFNQKKALVGYFSVITNLRMELFEALVNTISRGEHNSADRNNLQPADSRRLLLLTYYFTTEDMCYFTTLYFWGFNHHSTVFRKPFSVLFPNIEAEISYLLFGNHKIYPADSPRLGAGGGSAGGVVITSVLLPISQSRVPQPALDSSQQINRYIYI